MIGILNINKPTGVTSSQVVVKIKKLLNIKKVGHMGTLDPLASGVLPICVGKATRLFDYFLKKQKTYIACFKFGVETSTLDLEGEIVKQSNNLPTQEQLKKVLKFFLGEIQQVPPIYSSKKIDGKKAYNLARAGKSLELKPCLVNIFEYKLLEQIDARTFKFLITCSAGTYIRALARDLGYKLNSCATMTSLLRIKSGNFKIENALDYNNLSTSVLLKNLIPLEEVLVDFEKLIISKLDFQKLLNGQTLNYNNNFDSKLIVCENGNNQANNPQISKLSNSLIKNENKNYAIVVNNKIQAIGNISNNIIKIKTYLIDN